jgi:hypothetical protein
MIRRGPFRLAHSRQRRVAVVCLHRPVDGLKGTPRQIRRHYPRPEPDLPWVHDTFRGFLRLFLAVRSILNQKWRLRGFVADHDCCLLAMPISPRWPFESLQ